MAYLLPLGENIALIRYRPAGYLCVDLRSIDSLPYLFGLDIEAEVVPVFDCFLRPDSVVLDIGANFGLYTALAGRRLDRRGRLYAFEGNPEAFRCLVRTIAANAIWPKRNVTAVNLLISHENGQGQLHFAREALGGGTMADLGSSWGERQSIAVGMTCLDDFLPPGMAVDLVKIDVEGHEPLVVRGMEKTLSRSPDVRLLVEFYGQSAAHGVTANDFLDHVRGLGFAVCRLEPTIGLKRVEAGETLSEPCYCLFTRTAERDIQMVESCRRSLIGRIRRDYDRRLRGWRRKRLTG